MLINNALASLPVKDLAAAKGWYERLFGRTPDNEPMPTLAEWQFTGGGCLQVYEGAERAGGGSCTLTVSDLSACTAALRDVGIDPGKTIEGGKARVVMITDPDGNSIAFAQAVTADLAL